MIHVKELSCLSPAPPPCSQALLARTIFVTALVAIAVLLSNARNAVWLSDIDLLEDMVRKVPRKARVYNNLGIAYYEQDRYDDAARALERARVLDPNPDIGKTYGSLGLLYLTQAAMGRDRLIDKAIESLQFSLALMPNDPVTLQLLGDAYQFKGWERLASEQYERAESIEKMKRTER